VVGLSLFRTNAIRRRQAVKNQFSRFVAISFVCALALPLTNCGGGGGSPPPPPAQNPVPSITSISPTSATAGGAAFTLTVNGSNFIASSSVQWGGNPKITTYVSSTQLTASISANDIASAGTTAVTVFNPAPGGGTSNSADFTINNAANNPVPTLTSLNPPSAVAGGATFSLTVAGANFVSSSVVRWNGNPRQTTFVSSTQLTAAISANDIANAGTLAVTVFNPLPGGGTSSALPFNAHAGALGRNETCSTATPISNGVTRASISPYGDVDVYTFQGTAGQKVTIEIYAQRLDIYGDGADDRDVYLDSFLELLNSSCNQIAFDDDIDNGVLQDSLIQDFVLPATSTYYIRVSDLRGDGRPDFIYDLHLSGAN
jgi:hypothetical protein